MSQTAPGHTIMNISASKFTHIPRERPAPMAHSVLGSNPDRIGFHITEAVLIQCSKLFIGLECRVLSMVICTINNL